MYRSTNQTVLNMTDLHSQNVRSKNMAAVRSFNTQPELAVRQLLHKEGFRYRLHIKAIKGKPDIVMRKHGVLIFINGCFWHGHNCHLFRLPKTRTEWWRKKIESNKLRDITVTAELKSSGWRIIQVWECAIKGKTKIGHSKLRNQLIEAIFSEEMLLEIRGN